MKTDLGFIECFWLLDILARHSLYRFKIHEQTKMVGFSLKNPVAANSKFQYL